MWCSQQMIPILLNKLTKRKNHIVLQIAFFYRFAAAAQEMTKRVFFGELV